MHPQNDLLFAHGLSYQKSAKPKVDGLDSFQFAFT